MVSEIFRRLRSPNNTTVGNQFAPSSAGAWGSSASNNRNGVAFGSALLFYVSTWLRSPSGSSASVVYVVSVAGAAQGNDPAKAAAKNGVAFGFYQVHPRIHCSIYWLRSPTKSTVQAHEQVTADGAVRDTGKFSSYKQGVAFGFSGRVPKEQ